MRTTASSVLRARAGCGVAGMAHSYMVAFLLLCGLPAQAALPDTVDKIRPSIVAVGTVKPA